MAHPLAAAFEAAFRGSFPVVDGIVDVLPKLTGTADALIGFTGHWMLAADVDKAVVAQQLVPGDFSIPMSGAFVHWLAETLGTTSGPQDALFVATATGVPDDNDATILELERVQDLDHPRVRRAMRYREDVRVYSTEHGDGVVVLGRGVTRRWEVAFEAADGSQHAGLGRKLARAALTLLPEGTAIWAQVSPGNAASMRTVIAAGYRPIGAEILFPKRARS